jgi:D-glycero-alpha-D-manno-heptose-7-phosphate kinase
MPASTGMGGSSSFTVGLLNALHAFRGERVTPGQLAEEACYIEMDVLGEPIGKQDQYAAAFGGVNLFRFRPGGAVTVEPQRVRNGAVEQLFYNIMMFWTSHQRPASSVLVEQKARTSSNVETLCRMREEVFALQDLFSQPTIDPGRFGAILHRGWEMKRGLASRISDDEINCNYELAISAGAEGGKLCGAGGGGFLMFAVRPERRESVRRALSHLAYVPIGYETHGSYLLHPAHI